MLRIELEGNGPAGKLGGGPQVALLKKRIHLQHHPVGSHRKAFAFHVPLPEKRKDLFQALALLRGPGNVQPPFAGKLHILVMAVGGQRISQHVVDVRLQLAGCDDARVLQLQRARRRVARVGKERLLLLCTFLVEGIERAPRHQDLAPQLHIGRHIISFQDQRYIPDGTHVVGHIVSLFAVTPRHGTDQPPLFIVERDGGPVVLQLAHNRKLLVQRPFYTVVKIDNFPFRVGVLQGKHGVKVLHLGEVLIDIAPYPHGG